MLCGRVSHRLGALISKLDCIIHDGLHLCINVLDLGLTEDGLLQHKVAELWNGVPCLYRSEMLMVGHTSDVRSTQSKA